MAELHYKKAVQPFSHTRKKFTFPMTESCTPQPPGAYPSDCEVMDGYRKMARERELNSLSGIDPLVLEKAKNIKLLLLDVDGVLTDAALLYTSNGEECKAYNTQDGFGISLLHQAGLETGIITARKSAMVERRANELNITHIYQGARKKNEAFKEILKSTGIKPFEVAYMGDDWLDLILLQQVGLAVTPANGADELKSVVHYITSRPGGHGAVRDCCDLILKARGDHQKLLRQYTLG
ncbi:KdsC family phosphatase [Desulfosediminicola ganghwensis]|uniref:KdsC family phosphatase n=1 Tax=Desulfosediminicola ganghwensis TaxID=2569540 RepID=UPI001E4B4514|nr:HAD hydrolase family protein [Desulfosediminicola ganghwensis]